MYGTIRKEFGQIDWILNKIKNGPKGVPTQESLYNRESQMKRETKKIYNQIQAAARMTCPTKISLLPLSPRLFLSKVSSLPAYKVWPGRISEERCRVSFFPSRRKSLSGDARETCLGRLLMKNSCILRNNSFLS